MADTRHWTDHPAITALIRQRDDALAEVERLRHLIYDAHKWLPHSPETAAAVLKRTADDYANGGS